MSILTQKIKTKLPSRQESIPVFSTIVFFVFSWALYRAFWWMPSWLGYLSQWDVFILLAYVTSFALFESLGLLIFILLLSLGLPSRVFKDKFIPIGSTLAALISFGAVLLQRKIGVIYKLELWEYVLYPILILGAIFLLIFTLSMIFERFKTITSTVSAVAERMTVFSVLYVPIGVLGLSVVIIRNIF